MTRVIQILTTERFTLQGTRANHFGIERTCRHLAESGVQLAEESTRVRWAHIQHGPRIRGNALRVRPGKLGRCQVERCTGSTSLEIPARVHLCKTRYAHCMQDKRSRPDVGEGAGPTLLAAFGRTEDAAAALVELLDAGFINIEREVDGGRTVLVLDAGDQRNRAREIGGVAKKGPGQSGGARLPR